MCDRLSCAGLPAFCQRVPKLALLLLLPVLGLGTGTSNVHAQDTVEDQSDAVVSEHALTTGDASQGPRVALGADPALRKSLLAALDALGESYEPRTEHVFDDGSPHYVNRLILEDSPYLRQHAHNPVNWYPWGEEALAAARAQNKPIFLSIGYATCHWCHVMERESFENTAIAERLNTDYIAIKVDREQRPDVDALFMTAVMMINGSGGWPMSSFLDPEGRPFYGGTYYPPETFTTLLTRIDQLWKSEPETLLAQAGQLAEAITSVNQVAGEAREIGTSVLQVGEQQALTGLDREWGGFGEAPKFPRESTLIYLLERFSRTGNEAVREAIALTLERMAAGGIHDHVGGGFHRYAVDSRWLVPHFEKMLYNQAALARIYARAASLGIDRARNARIARRTLDYVLRDMRSAEGLFYSATDADSEGEEGRFFVWTPEQLEAALGEEAGREAAEVWGVTGEGNFEGTSILHYAQPIDTLTDQLGVAESQLYARLDLWSEQLRLERETRVHPLRDEKIITAWNAMLVTALVDAAEQLNEPRYLDAGQQAADELWRVMAAESGQLKRTHFEGRSSIEATQADYAYFAEAAIALYDSTGNTTWLERAEQLTEQMIERFWNSEGGGFYMGAESVSGASLVTRMQDFYDNTIASGNSVALHVLSRLSVRTGKPHYRETTDALIASVSSRLSGQPAAHFYMLSGINDYLEGEFGPRRFLANGVVRARGRIEDERIVVSLDIAPGWHVNADKPLQDYLIPTLISQPDDVPYPDVQYPEAHLATLGFQQGELALYEGQVSISAQLPPAAGEVGSDEVAGGEVGRAKVASGEVDGEGQVSGTGNARSAKPDQAPAGRAGTSLPVSLQLQACNDTTCLAPETVTLSVPFPPEIADAG